jgi:hypothetical protein
MTEYREPLRTTLLRTITIAVVAGPIAARAGGHGVSAWPFAILLALWPSFGGHWVELWFINWLMPRLPEGRGVLVAARLAVWFVGGVVLMLGVCVTAMLLVGFPPGRWPALWIGGLAFIAIELVPHLFLQLRGRPSFYNGRG